MNKNVQWLCESAVMIALAFVLSFVSIIKMPFGGSITACSMLPIILVSFRYGTKKGLAVGFVYGLIQLLTDTGIFSYATSAAAAIIILLCDYLLAFSALGLGGIFKKSKISQPLAVCSGALVACAVRYLMHCVSGYVVWSDLTKTVGERLVYDIVYNSAYMVPETLITVAGAWYIAKNVDLSREKLARIQNKKSIPATEYIFGSISVLFAVLTVCYAAVKLFFFMQTEDGYSAAALLNADYSAFLMIIGMGIILCGIFAGIKYALHKKNGNG